MDQEENHCVGCSKPKSFFQSFSKCALCSNYYIDHRFCNKCYIHLNYKLSDKLLRRKYCYSCYSVIEFSKQQEGDCQANASEDSIEELKQTKIPSDKEVSST